MKNTEYEMSADEARIAKWLERCAKAELSQAANRESNSAHLQRITGSGLKEMVAAQIRLGMHRE